MEIGNESQVEARTRCGETVELSQEDTGDSHCIVCPLDPQLGRVGLIEGGSIEEQRGGPNSAVG